MSKPPIFYADLAVAILAGGASQRFGSDKAAFRLRPGGPTMIERTVSIANELSDTVVIIGKERAALSNLGVQIIPDDDPGRGPLIGIATALRAVARPRVLVLGCDMPCLSLPLLRMMIERSTGGNIVIPRTNDGRWHPMHAIFPTSSLQPILQALNAGETSVRSILDKLPVEAVPEAELRTIDPRLDSLFNLNEPADIPYATRCQS